MSKKKIYLIMPVRASSAAKLVYASQYCGALEAQGHEVHFPPRDAPQDDPTGEHICKVHLAAMQAADEVHVLWDPESYGSHFDLGMAYALGKPIKGIDVCYVDRPGKSYWKAVIAPGELASHAARRRLVLTSNGFVRR